MWGIFQDTGRIEAYLYYRSCQEGEGEAKEEGFEPGQDGGEYGK